MTTRLSPGLATGRAKERGPPLKAFIYVDKEAVAIKEKEGGGNQGGRLSTTEIHIFWYFRSLESRVFEGTIITVCQHNLSPGW
jgi:hypothetical protein